MKWMSVDVPSTKEQVNGDNDDELVDGIGSCLNFQTKLTLPF